MNVLRGGNSVAAKGEIVIQNAPIGPDPQTWPAWTCQTCDQRHSGWALECPRCGGKREMEWR